MKYYLAPMEGITGFVFRNAYHDYFAPMDKYFAPFVSPNQNICFTPREYRDICPENNRIPNVVPQILTNKAEDFIKTSQELAKMGYGEVNLNLGCPSGTVTAKRKGAGFLMETGRLREFFDRIFERPSVRISVKTRLGMYSPDEFAQLLEIFNEYPLEELIIHPRAGKEFYEGIPHRDVYFDAVGKSKNPLCYNGDLYRAEDVVRLAGEWNAAGDRLKGSQMYGLQKEKEPKKKCRTAQQKAVMLGRGILRDPWLVAKCRKTGQESAVSGDEIERVAEDNTEIKQTGIRDFPSTTADTARIREFSDRLFSDYAQYMGERNAMFRMKELWLYLAESFAEADANRKKLKKAQNQTEFNAVLEGLHCRS